MHWLITILCPLAVFAQTCTDSGIYWSLPFFWNENWAYYLSETGPPGHDGTVTPTYANHVAASLEMRKDAAACDPKPVYIMCPSVNTSNAGFVNVEDESNCGNAELCLLYKAAMAIPPQPYHTHILAGFSNAINPGPNVQSAAYHRFQDVYGTALETDNYPFFTFRPGFEARGGPQERYLGPPFDLAPYLAQNQLKQLKDDPYMQAWAHYFAKRKGGDVNNIFAEDTYAAFEAQTLVSSSIDLCWSLLLSALPDRSMEPGDIIPTVADGRSTTVWKDGTLGDCKCGPYSAPKYQCIGGSLPGSGIDECKAQCLLRSDCTGVFYNQEDNTGYLAIPPFGSPDVFECNERGQFRTCLILNRYEEPSGLAFHGSGTFPEVHTLAPTVSYELTENYVAGAISPGDSNTLRSCQDRQEEICYVTPDGAYATLPESDLLRVYTRRADNTPGRCSSRCMNDPTCLAWTWDQQECKLTTDIGKITSSGMPANKRAMEMLGLDVTTYCPIGQAMDTCSRTCVDIGDPLQMGWCNKAWVNCVGTEDAATNNPTADERMCVGGSMPYVPPTGVADKKRFSPATADVTQPGQSTHGIFPVTGKNRRNTTIYDFKGAYLTGEQCGNVGASSTGGATFADWAAWSTASLLTAPNVMSIESNENDVTNTYVTAARGTTITGNGDYGSGSAYSSTAAGILGIAGWPGDCGASAACVFPTCMYGNGQNPKGQLFGGAMPSGDDCTKPDPYTQERVVAVDYYDTAITAYYDYMKLNTGTNGYLVGNPACPQYNTASQELSYGEGTILNPYSRADDNTCKFDKTTTGLGTFLGGGSKFYNTKFLWNEGYFSNQGGGYYYGGIISDEKPRRAVYGTDVSDCTSANADDPQTGVKYSLLKQGGHYFCAPSDEDNYLMCMHSGSGGVSKAGISGPRTPAYNAPSTGQCYHADYVSHHSGGVGSLGSEHHVSGYALNSGETGFGGSFLNHAVVEDVNAGRLIMDSYLCSTQITPAGGKFVNDILASSGGNLRDSTVSGMNPNNYVDATNFQDMKGTTNTQLYTADGGLLLDGRQSFFHKRQRETGASYIFTKLPSDKTLVSPVWPGFDSADFKTFARSISTFTGRDQSATDYYTSTTMSDNLYGINARNAGLMCPVGIYTLPNTKSEKSLPTADTDTLETPGEGVWHKYAQLTLKCPANKPYRCSHMTVQKPSGGTCEYGFGSGDSSNWFSGRVFGTRPTNINNLASGKSVSAAMAYLSKLQRNSLCNVYDHGCYSKEEISDTQVCGIDTGDGTSNMGGVLCGTDPGSGSAEYGGFCGGMPTVDKPLEITAVKAKAAYEGCQNWPSAERPCEPGFMIYWGNPANPLTDPMCVPTSFATKKKINFENHLPATMHPTTANSTDDTNMKWWPGFVEKEGSFAGVGPAFVSSHGACDSNPHSCQGFDLCGIQTYTDQETCLTEEVLNSCCYSAQQDPSTVLLAADGMCEIMPTAVCAGGKHLFSPLSVDGESSGKNAQCGIGNAQMANPCACCSTECKDETWTAIAQTELDVSSGHAAGYSGTLNELTLSFVDTTTRETLDTDTCIGPVNRLTGSLWRKGTPSCACRNADYATTDNFHGPLYAKDMVDSDTNAQCTDDTLCVGHSATQNFFDAPIDLAQLRLVPDTYSHKKTASRPHTCDPTESCAYTQTRQEVDGFAGTGGANITGPLECLNVTASVAQGWCIAMGKQCIGLQYSSPLYCAVTVENTVTNTGGDPYYARYTAPHRVGWAVKPSSTLATFKPTKYTGLHVDAIKSVCALDATCKGVAWTTDTNALIVSSMTGGTTGDYIVAINEIVRPDSSCTKEYPYAFAYNGVEGSSCCQTSDAMSTGTHGPLLDSCPAFIGCPTNTTNATTCQSYYTSCPKHAPCNHGTNVREVGAPGSPPTCRCICDDSFSGPTCAICTRLNTQDDCKTCNENYVKAVDDTCICKSGFDISTDCTACIDGFTGSDCQTDTCTYTVDEGSVTLKNAVVARRGDVGLYDGIYAAGDGMIPMSMQNSLVMQDGHLWWMYSSTMDTGGTLNSGRREVLNTAVCSQWNSATPCAEPCGHCTTGVYYKNQRALMRCSTTGTAVDIMLADQVYTTCTDIMGLSDFNSSKGIYYVDAPDDFDDIVHYTAGQWIYSIDKYVPWEISYDMTMDTSMDNCQETLLLSNCVDMGSTPLPPTPAGGGGATTSAPPPAPTPNDGYCGATSALGDLVCESPCSQDSQCPTTHQCWKAASCGTATPNDGYCGATSALGALLCDSPCSKDSQCATPLKCWLAPSCASRRLVDTADECTGWYYGKQTDGKCTSKCPINTWNTNTDPNAGTASVCMHKCPEHQCVSQFLQTQGGGAGVLTGACTSHPLYCYDPDLTDAQFVPCGYGMWRGGVNLPCDQGCYNT